ncbi:MAG: hypothetical protein U1A25_00685 [Candidatus Sungbacteria bacterium]|nr:hypothetical protein [bacterium]MDZ4260160.1 hypothetical protein [Candidatus Sungbacteria bacterium]
MSNEALTLTGLIERIFEAGREDDLLACMNLGQALHQYVYVTPDIVDMVLGELECRKVEDWITYEDQRAVFELISFIEDYVTQKHAQRIAALCMWDEIAWAEDGSTRSAVLSALTRIGGPEEIPTLQAFSEKIRGIEYGLDGENGKIFHHPGRLKASELYAMNQVRVRDVIDAIMSRNQ